MGFFKDLRDDISQAVNELLPDDDFFGIEEEETAEEDLLHLEKETENSVEQEVQDDILAALAHLGDEQTKESDVETLEQESVEEEISEPEEESNVVEEEPEETVELSEESMLETTEKPEIELSEESMLETTEKPEIELSEESMLETIEKSEIELSEESMMEATEESEEKLEEDMLQEVSAEEDEQMPEMDFVQEEVQDFTSSTDMELQETEDEISDNMEVEQVDLEDSEMEAEMTLSGESEDVVSAKLEIENEGQELVLDEAALEKTDLPEEGALENATSVEESDTETDFEMLDMGTLLEETDIAEEKTDMEELDIEKTDIEESNIESEEAQIAGENELEDVSKVEEADIFSKWQEDEDSMSKDDKTEVSEPIIEENMIEKEASIMENILENVQATDQVTVITKGTVINGSISSDGGLEVNGTITGDVECLGKLTINGNVSGNLKASEVVVSTPRLSGGIDSQGDVKIGVGTIVVGDVTAKSATISGAVKGEIDVQGPVVVDSTAIVKGNITAKSVQINNGAVVDGYCKLTYAEVDIDNFFDGE